MIAVTGASGQLGRLVVAGLKAAGQAATTVALARDPAKIADLGVAARQADYGAPETLVPALAGIDVLILISSSEVGQRAAQHLNVIGAAKAAGVGRVVYTSLLRADSSPLAALAAEHVTTEAALKASGLAYTILRNGWYVENFFSRIPPALQTGVLAGAAGHAPINAATRADYAAAAVAVALGTGHENRTYELAGDTAFTLDDLAAVVAETSGRAVGYRDIGVAAFAEALTGAGLPEGIAAFVADLDAGTAAGALASDDRTLPRLIGRPTTPMAAAVAAEVAAVSAAA